MSNSKRFSNPVAEGNELNNSLGEDQIAKLCTQLPQEKQPQRDLFSGIEFAIQANEQNTGRGGATKPMLYGLAASVCLVAFVAYFSYQSGVSNSGQKLVKLLSEQHQQQKESLLASYAGTPEKTQNWQQQSQDLDKAAIAIKKALENDPNNAALLKMLKKVHEQQITLIERVHAPAWQQI